MRNDFFLIMRKHDTKYFLYNVKWYIVIPALSSITLFNYIEGVDLFCT